ncbi:hypothetical protein [Methanocella paludicola]|uniref:hypothetical protein n=1 Tax=Methanocella paludicola TaxID=570267 RepID=UPI000FFB2E7B|nr:hypothetical protein [Methanocella paludicola]
MVGFIVGFTVGFTAAFVLTVGYTVGFIATIFLGMVGFIVGFGVDFMAAFALVVRSDMIALMDGLGFFVTAGVFFAFCITLSVPLTGALAVARPTTRTDPIKTMAMTSAAYLIAIFSLDNPITRKKNSFSEDIWIIDYYIN